MSLVARRHHRRGIAALDRGDLDQASEALAAALELCPTMVSARVGLAVAMARAGDHPRAAQLLRAGLGRPATSAGRGAMWATLGDVLTLSGDLAGAADAFGQAAGEPGFAARAASGLGRVHAKAGRYGEALAELGRAAALCDAQGGDGGPPTPPR